MGWLKIAVILAIVGRATEEDDNDDDVFYDVIDELDTVPTSTPTATVPTSTPTATVPSSKPTGVLALTIAPVVPKVEEQAALPKITPVDECAIEYKLKPNEYDSFVVPFLKFMAIEDYKSVLFHFQEIDGDREGISRYCLMTIDIPTTNERANLKFMPPSCHKGEIKIREFEFFKEGEIDKIK